MPKKGPSKKKGRPKTAKAKARKAPKSAKKTAEKTGKSVGTEADVSKRAVSDLLTRGEAAPLDEKGNLPPGATHQITGKQPDGTVTLKRRRLYAF